MFTSFRARCTTLGIKFVSDLQHVGGFLSVLLQYTDSDYPFDIFKLFYHMCLCVCLMVFNATFNNISVIFWRSVSLVEETGGTRENHKPVASHWPKQAGLKILMNTGTYMFSKSMLYYKIYIHPEILNLYISTFCLLIAHLVKNW
jgi:hypothetical protein